jgi:stage II sporulation protein M
MKSKSKKRGSKKKRGFFVDNYIKSWKYIKESKNFIFASIGIFLLFVLIGFFVKPPEQIIELIMKYIEDLLKVTEGKNGLEMFWFIFKNNFSSSFTGIFSGILLGVFPILSSVLNGYLVGFVINVSVANLGILSLWRLLPHGIFELPAIFISFGMGIRMGMFIFNKNKIDSLVYYIKNSFRVFVFVIFPLLIVAGLIEGFLIVLLK